MDYAQEGDHVRFAQLVRTAQAVLLYDQPIAKIVAFATIPARKLACARLDISSGTRPAPCYVWCPMRPIEPAA